MFDLQNSRKYLASVVFTLLIGSGGVLSTANAQVPNPGEGSKSAAAAREQLSASFAEVAKAVEPAVVSIDTKGRVPDVSTRGGAQPGDSDDIMELFRRQLPRRPLTSVGSGFIVDKSGYILTNAHVVSDASRITVKLENGKEYLGTVVGTDDETDLAVVKIDADHELPVARLGDSDAARVGEWVLAIGSPFGLARTVTAGIVSQTRRETPGGTAFQRFIQTDAAINKGNSGGPLVNMNGEVIGINSQIVTSTGDYNGVGFAFPSNEASKVYEQIRKFGRVKRGYLGVQLESVKEEYARIYGLKEPKGAIVIDVPARLSPAATAGLKPGDVIIEFDGKPVINAQDLIGQVSGQLPDAPVTIVYMRDSGTVMERKTASIKLIERQGRRASDEPDTSRKLPPAGGKEEQKPFGLTLSELTPSVAASYKLGNQKGVVVKEINPTSYIADVRLTNGVEALEEGDLIQRINRVSIANLKQFNDAVLKLKPGDAVVLEVLSYNGPSRAPQLKIVQFTVQ